MIFSTFILSHNTKIFSNSNQMNFRIIILSFTIFISFNIFAKSYKVENIDQYKEKVETLIAGDTIILTNGVWKDAKLVFKGTGEMDKQIYLMAETPGKVTLEGKSSLQISGKWLQVSGLVFVNGSSPKGTVIDFRTSSKDYAYNCVLTNCVIDKYNLAAKDSSDHWIGLYGKNNTIEYCYFGGKSNKGTTLVVWPNDSNSINNNHLIYRNYFGARPRLGSNGGETIRIGTSQVCTNSSATIVEGNYFEHCNGEVEIISNKSCDNKFSNNTFFECEGCLTLRHGNRATVSGNWFIGNGKDNTGGVRVINEGHLIYNNYFYKLRGDDFRSGLTIMNAIPNSPANGYAPVRNVVIANNTFYDCSSPWIFGAGFGERDRTVTPQNTLLLNNLVYCPNTDEIINHADKTEGIILNNNILISSKGVLSETGCVSGEALMTKVWGVDVPYTTVKAKKLPYVKYDLVGQLRGEAVIGALQNKDEKPAVVIATSINCGPQWYNSAARESTQNAKPIGKTTPVEPGIDNLYNAVKKAGNGDILILKEGEYVVTKRINISKNITIQSSSDKKPVVKLKIDRANGSIFEIGGNARLKMKGIAINGDSKAEFPAKYAFITSKEGATGYFFMLDNCEIYDFNVEAGAIYKAYKGSLADSIIISNSVFRDSYRGFSLGEEKEDVGKYSAENVVFENSVFTHFSQYVIDYYRGGNDESTLGGSLKVNHCVFDRVGNDEKQTILKLTGIKNVAINNSIFNNSMAKMSVKLSGSKNKISNCDFNACPKPIVENGAKSTNILFINPNFEKNSFILSTKSGLTGKSLDGSNIGLR